MSTSFTDQSLHRHRSSKKAVLLKKKKIKDDPELGREGQRTQFWGCSSSSALSKHHTSGDCFLCMHTCIIKSCQYTTFQLQGTWNSPVLLIFVTAHKGCGLFFFLHKKTHWSTMDSQRHIISSWQDWDSSAAPSSKQSPASRKDYSQNESIMAKMVLLAASFIVDFFHFYSLCASSMELFPELPLIKFWAPLLTAYGDWWLTWVFWFIS